MWVSVYQWIDACQCTNGLSPCFVGSLVDRMERTCGARKICDKVGRSVEGTCVMCSNQVWQRQKQVGFQ